ncbi:MAG TPA: AAA family ATPase [Frankiaceae bacterium]|nr:AAA family ATPase [Frankiaceae bacterium]
MSSPAVDRAGSGAGSASVAAEIFTAFCAAGLWPGMGKALRDKLPAAGIHEPSDVTEDALAAVPGLSARRAAKLMVDFARARPTYEVVALLLPAELPARLAGGALGALGPGAAAVLGDDPWRLLDGGEADLRQADRLAATLGKGRAEPARGPAVLVHLLMLAARAGDTSAPADILLSGAFSRGVPDPADALERAVEGARVVLDEPAGDGDARQRLVTLPRYANAEESLAEGLARLNASAKPIGEPDALGVTGLDEAQRAAVVAALVNGVSLLTGGPGTGKSRTVSAVVELATARGCTVALAAPTGRAAKRLEELTGESASTVHRLLGAQPVRETGPNGSPVFTRGEGWPLDADVVVVDEASMLDAELAAAVVQACRDGTHLLLVGDPAQLPSIGPGRVLGDLIDSRTVVTTELITLYRQAEGGTIASLATAVRGGALPAVEDPEREVVIVPSRDSTEAARRVVQLVTDSIPRVLGIPSSEIQVVTPVHRGPAGTEALNLALKEVLNPTAANAPAPKGRKGVSPARRFDVGDRIVAIANHLDEGFANGEVGTVAARTSDGLVITFSGVPVTVPVTAWSDLRHGWAITVHRAQGSEWPAVVVVLPPESGGLLTRPLVYTALTRAQRHLSVVPAVGGALARAVRENGGRQRVTRLPGLLEDAFSGASLSGTDQSR